MGAGRGGRSARPVERRRSLSACGDVSLIQQIRHVLQMPHPQTAERLGADFPDSLPPAREIVAAPVLLALVEHPMPTFILPRRSQAPRPPSAPVHFPPGGVAPAA